MNDKPADNASTEDQQALEDANSAALGEYAKELAVADKERFASCTRSLNPDRLMVNVQWAVRRQEHKVRKVVAHRAQLLQNTKHNEGLLYFYKEAYQTRTCKENEKKFPSLKQVLKEMGEEKRSFQTRILNLESDLRREQKLRQQFAKLAKAKARALNGGVLHEPMTDSMRLQESNEETMRQAYVFGLQKRNSELDERVKEKSKALAAAKNEILELKKALAKR